MKTVVVPAPRAEVPGRGPGVAGVTAAPRALARVRRLFEAIPYGAVALLARIAVAAVFWRSGQTKVEGFVLDLVDGTFQWGLPRLAPQAVDLFRDEYRLPLIAPDVAAVLAATAEHLLPALLLVGLATRLSALGLLVMTAVIQVLVYPGAWPVHATWAALLLMLMSRGPGACSLDHAIARRWQR